MDKNKDRMKTISRIIYICWLMLFIAAVHMVMYGCAGPSSQSHESSGEDTHMIIIKDFHFSPDTMTIGKNDALTWKNNDRFSHTITSDDRKFSSPIIKKGETYTFTFDEAGEYSYHCMIHPTVKGKIIVR